MFGRSKLDTKMRASSSASRCTISSRVMASAVAVSAMRGTFGKRSCSTDKLNVFRAEIVPPLRHAMRFVDGEQADARALEQFQKARRHQPFGRHVEQVDLAVAQRALGGRGFRAGQRRIQERGAHADFA